MNWRAEVEALREAAERNKAQYPVECERLQGFPDGFTIPDEAQWPEDWIRVVHKERRLARADERERVKARVEGLKENERDWPTEDRYAIRAFNKALRAAHAAIEGSEE